MLHQIIITNTYKPLENINYEIRVFFKSRDELVSSFIKIEIWLKKIYKEYGWEVWGLLRSLPYYGTRRNFIVRLFLFVPHPNSKLWKSFYDNKNHKFKDTETNAFFSGFGEYYVVTATRRKYEFVLNIDD